VVTEKVALLPALRNIYEPLQVGVMGNRGWASLRSMYTAFQMMLEQQQAECKMIVILYFGDLDPSGAEMSEDFQRRLEIFSDLEERKGGKRLKYTFERIAVTAQQIDKLKLDWIPDREIKDKLLGVSEREAELTGKKKKDPDPNAAAYMAKYQGFVDQHSDEVAGLKSGDDEFSRYKDSIWFPVLELEAVTSLRRKEFRKMARDTVLKRHYDPQIWEENKHLFDRELVTKQVKKRMKDGILDKEEDDKEEE